MADERKQGTTIAGLAIFGCIVTGFFSFLAAIPVILYGNHSAGGMLLIASALSFGLLSIGVLSK